MPRADVEAPFSVGEEKPVQRGSSRSTSTFDNENPGATLEHKEDGSIPRTRQPSVSALLRNPLAGMSTEEVLQDVDTFINGKGLQASREAFRKGALLARVNQRPDAFESISMLSDQEKQVLRHELTHRWSQPFTLYFLVVLCAGSAIVQGMDQTAVNGAQVSSFSTSPFGRLLYRSLPLHTCSHNSVEDTWY